MKYQETICSADSNLTFHSSEGQRGAEVSGVGGEAAHLCAATRVVHAAGLRVVLRGTARRLGARGHGVGGGVHVALLLHQTVFFVGQSLCWRDNTTNFQTPFSIASQFGDMSVPTQPFYPLV